MAYGIDEYDFSRTDFKSMEELRGNLDGQDWPGIRPFASLLMGLTIAVKAKLIFEIGTGGLWSTQCFLHGLEKTDGRIISCDTIKRFKDFSHAKFQFMNAPSYEIVKTWTRELDILFIDGDHSYKGVIRDYALFSPFVRKGGIILFHDTNHSHFPGIKKAVDEVEGLQRIVFTEFPGLIVCMK